MYSYQLLKLSEYILKDLKGDEQVLIMEPISLKKKHLKRLDVGDYIDLGKELPRFYIQKGDNLIAEAIIKSDSNNFIVDSIELPKGYKEDIELRAKRVLLKPIIMVIDSNKNTLYFDWNILERVYLYLDNRAFIRAKFGVSKDNRYLLKIEELFNE